MIRGLKMTELSILYQSVLEGDAKAAVAVTKEALAAGIDPSVLVTEYMIPAMAEVGQRFECQQYYVPEVLLAARAMKGALELIRPALTAKGAQPAGRVVIGTVKGDLHDIGKNLVASMLEGAGFEVIDLGVDVSPARFLAELQSQNAEILALSALLTTTMPIMEKTIQELNKAGLRQKVKVMIGGAPVTQQYADQIGADAYSDNANGAVAAARRFAGAGQPSGGN
jgi:corrinoid protein of di/trimethylamine methyltransferase